MQGVQHGEVTPSDAVADTLSQVAAGCCELDATGKRISLSELDAITCTLANSSNVRITLMARTGLGDSGAVQLAEGIRRNRCVLMPWSAGLPHQASDTLHQVLRKRMST